LKTHSKIGRGIYRRGNVFWLTVQKDGTRHFITLETTDPVEAVKRAASIRETLTLAASEPLAAEVRRFIAYKVRQQEYTRSTEITKRNKLLLFAASLPPGITAVSVTARHVQRFYDETIARASVSTALGYLMTVRAFFRWAIEVAGIARHNPTKSVRLVKSLGRARKDFCDFELRDRLLADAPNEDLRFILFCGFHAGLRFQEIVEARPFWFDTGAGQLHLRKTATMNFKDREERTIPLTLAFRTFLNDYGMRAPFMLKPEVPAGRSLYRYDFRLPFMSYMKAQGCEWVTPHIMRHTFASLLVSAGESVYKVAVWLGDEVTTVQKHYGHLTPDDHGIEKAFSLRHASGNSPASNRTQQTSKSVRL
jgi:integrase